MSRRKRRAVLVLTAASAAVAAMFASVPSRYAAHREWKKGLAAAEAGDFVDAETAFKACLAARPADAECGAGQAMASHINSSWTRFPPVEPVNSYTGRSETPQPSLERVNPETPGTSPSELSSRYAKEGLLHAERGEYPQALDAFRSCISLDPANPACQAGVRLYGSLASSARGGVDHQPAPAPSVTTEEDRKRAVMHWNEGIKAFQKGDASSARDEWSLCRRFDAGNTDCANGLSRLDQAYGGGQ